MRRLARESLQVLHGALALDTHVLSIDDRLTLACVPRGEKAGSSSPIPPLGRLFGAPLLADQAVTLASAICFEAFATTDFVEMTYDDFARLEQPRVAAVAMAGELPSALIH